MLTNDGAHLLLCLGLTHLISVSENLKVFNI